MPVSSSLSSCSSSSREQSTGSSQDDSVAHQPAIDMGEELNEPWRTWGDYLRATIPVRTARQTFESFQRDLREHRRARERDDHRRQRRQAVHSPGLCGAVRKRARPTDSPMPAPKRARSSFAADAVADGQSRDESRYVYPYLGKGESTRRKPEAVKCAEPLRAENGASPTRDVRARDPSV
jgi:hypothetical protein